MFCSARCACSLSLVALLLSAGCALIERGWNETAAVTEPGEPSEAASRSAAHPTSAPKPRDVIAIEFVFVERPVNDPLLGEALWQDVAKVGNLTPETRERLGDNGFRIGHVGNTPPPALQTLLGLEAEISDVFAPADEKKLVVRRVMIPDGGEAEIQTGPLISACAVPVRTESRLRMNEYEAARCVFRVKAERLQEGWAKLEFQPEIHHGPVRPRRVPADGGWQYSNSQQIDPLFSLRFAVKLNVGEMAVLTVDRPQSESAGRRFFLMGDEDESQVQRLLIVRLADMVQSKPVRVE